MSFWHNGGGGGGGGEQTKAHPDRLWNQLNFTSFQKSARVSRGGMFGRKARSAGNPGISGWRQTGRPLLPPGITFPDVGGFVSERLQQLRPAGRPQPLAASVVKPELQPAVWPHSAVQQRCGGVGEPSRRALHLTLSLTYLSVSLRSDYYIQD